MSRASLDRDLDHDDLSPYSHIRRSMEWCLNKLETIHVEESHSFTDRVNSILDLAKAEEGVIRRVFAQNDRSYINGSVLHYAEGLFDVFGEVPDQVKRCFPRLWDELEVPVVIDASIPLVHTFPPKHLFALPAEMRRARGAPTIVPNMDTFRKNFDIFTNRAFINVRNWDNIAVAGGAVLACLQPTSFDESSWTPLQANLYFENFYANSDVDIFIYGLNVEEAEARMIEFYEDVISAFLQPPICVRKAGSITIRGKGVRPIQIVLRLYHQIAEIICGFDVDSACCLFDGDRAWANLRFLLACMRQANTVDLSRRSPSYEVRHHKYSKRAFELYVPDLQRDQIDAAFIYNREILFFPPGLARLVIFEYLGIDPFFYPNLHYRGKRIRKIRTMFGKIMDFTPMEHSAYDRVWARLPGVEFSSDEIAKHVDTMNALMNSPYKQRKYRCRIHRHFISHGTMQECIEGVNCINCPSPITDEEKTIVEQESTRYIRGRISFIEHNPGRQLVGSFNPITDGEWEVNVYRAYGPPPPPTFLSRRLSHWRLMRHIFP